jgi:hypothetical protein
LLQETSAAAAARAVCRKRSSAAAARAVFPKRSSAAAARAVCHKRHQLTTKAAVRKRRRVNVGVLTETEMCVAVLRELGNHPLSRQGAGLT